MRNLDNLASTAEVSMTMNAEGAKQWKRLTADNIGKSVAIVLMDMCILFLQYKLRFLEAVLNYRKLSQLMRQKI